MCHIFIRGCPAATFLVRARRAGTGYDKVVFPCGTTANIERDRVAASAMLYGLRRIGQQDGLRYNDVMYEPCYVDYVGPPKEGTST